MFSKLKNFLFINSSNTQTIAKNTIWLGVGEIGSRILKLVVFVQAARLLGVVEWGLFSYALALLGTASIFSDIGMNAILLREVSKKSERMSSYISTSFFLKALLSLGSALMLMVSISFIDSKSITSLIPLIAVLLCIDSMREFGFALNRAFEKMELEAFTKLISGALLAAVALLFISYRATAYSLLISYIVAGALSLVVLSVYVRKYFSRMRKNFDKNLLFYILKEAWPIGIVAVFVTILANIDTLLLGWIQDTTQVGYYAAAQKPIQVLSIIPSLISSAVLPYFSRNTGIENEQTFKQGLGKAITFSYALVTPLVVVCILFGKQIITVLFGIEFLPAVSILQILSVSALAIVPSIFLSNALLALGKQKRTIQFIVCGAVSNILLSIILIPRYGMYGAATSYTASHIISNIFIVVQTRSFVPLRFTLSFKSVGKEIVQFLKR